MLISQIVREQVFRWRVAEQLFLKHSGSYEITVRHAFRGQNLVTQKKLFYIV